MIDADTLPKSLRAACRIYGEDRTAMRQKDMGVWRSFTWKESHEQVRTLCLGLLGSGFKRGETSCIIGGNYQQCFWAQLGIQAAGGAAVGIFTDSTPPEIEFVVQHADARVG